MTRTYAARRLLEHGPLTHAEFVAITGWPRSAASKVLWRLRELGVASSVNHRHLTVWSLA